MLLTIHDMNLRKVASIDNDKQGTLNYFNDTWTRYLETGSSTFDFTVFKKAIKSDTGSKKAYNYLNEKSFISFEYEGETYLFTVRKVVENENLIKCNCVNLNLELINEYANPYKATKAMTFNEYCQAMDLLNFTMFTIGLNELSDNKVSAEWEGADTKLARLLSLASKFGAELEFRTFLNDDSTIKQIVVNVYQAADGNHLGVGKLHTKPLRYGKDFKTLIRTVDKTEIYNMVRPTGKDDQGNVVTISGLGTWSVKNDSGELEFYQDGESLYAPLSMQMYPAAFTSGTMEDQWIRKDMTVESSSPEVIRATAYRELKKYAYPAVTYELEGFTNLGIGDTVHVYDDGFSPALLLEMRVSEQAISFTNSANNKTTFANARALESKLSQGIQARIDQMLEDAKPYTVKFSTNNGTAFKNGLGSSLITPTLKRGTEVISGASFAWYVNGALSKTGDTFEVLASTVKGTAVFKVEAMVGGQVVASTEVTFTNVSDGTNGQQGPIGPQGPKGDQGIPGPIGLDGKPSYVHVAYAEKSNKLVTATTGPTAYSGSVVTQNGISYSAIGGTNEIKACYTFTGTTGKSGWLLLILKNTGSSILRIAFNGIFQSNNTNFNTIQVEPNNSYYFIKQAVARSTYDYCQITIRGLSASDNISFETYDVGFYDGPPFINFSQAPTPNTTHTGIYSDSISKDSTNIADYRWSLSKGADGTNGLPGKPGADGKTSYWHTAYANSADGKVDFHLTDNTGRRYFGHYNDYVLADSTDPTKYTWVDMAAPAEKIVKEQAVLKTDVKVTDEGIVTSASKTVNGQTIASMIAQRAEWVEIITQLLKIKADMIVDGAITADKLNVAVLSALTSNLGTVTAGNLLLQRSFKAGSSVIPAYKYPDYKTGLFVDNHGLLVNGMPVQKTFSETMASDMPIVAVTAGEVRFSRVDITENLERLLHEGLSDPDFGSIQFGRDPDGRNALVVQSNGQIYLKAENFTDWSMSTVNNNVRWKVQGNLVIVDYDVTFPTSGTKHIVTVSTRYVPKALMLDASAWYGNNTKDKKAQLNTDGGLHILGAEANQRYCGQIFWAY